MNNAVLGRSWQQLLLVFAKGKLWCSIAIPRLAKFFLCSIFIHLITLKLLGAVDLIEYGSAQNMRSSVAYSSVLAATIVASPLPLKQVVAQSIEKQKDIVEPKIAMAVTQGEGALEIVSENEPLQGYVPVGNLTNPPFPLGDIDLNVSEIDEVAVDGKMELTLYIDEVGTVVEVVMSAGVVESSVFVERVAKRFYNTQFSPGEIQGKRVKSKFTVTIISESHP